MTRVSSRGLRLPSESLRPSAFNRNAVQLFISLLAEGLCHRSLGQRPRNWSPLFRLAKGHNQRKKSVNMAFGQNTPPFFDVLGRCPRLR